MLLCHPKESELTSRDHQKHLLRIEVEKGTLELKPLQTFGQVRVPRVFNAINFHMSAQRSQAPRPALSPAYSAHQEQFPAADLHLMVSRTAATCLVWKTSKPSEENHAFTSSLRKHVPNYTAKVFDPGGVYSPQTLEREENDQISNNYS